MLLCTERKKNYKVCIWNILKILFMIEVVADMKHF